MKTAKATLICDECGESFQRYLSQICPSGNVFCSRECSSEWLRKKEALKKRINQVYLERKNRENFTYSQAWGTFFEMENNANFGIFRQERLFLKEHPDMTPDLARLYLAEARSLLVGESD